ncbi:hypothetical protein H5410_046488 [Solanum commersonii]|uniref:Ubiquitin-like protease family profile domain-containing protein n=1 Tax=Solanum commersonii TaxID=4109 RepID=A0A9J5XFT6_SOLCO|nr:hypothetical protein H5410_046488 [Solanum commersonii]
MAKDPDYVKFEGFPLTFKSNQTSRIFNWDISKIKIYFDHLNKGMFRKYGNQYIFQDLVFMDEELAIIEAENLTVLTDIPSNKKSKHLPHISAQKVGSDPSLSVNKDLQKFAQEVVKVRNELEKFEKNVATKFVEMKAFMDSSFKHIIQELKSLQNDVSTNKDLGVERSGKMNEIACRESKDQCDNETYNSENRSIRKEGLNMKVAGDVNDLRKERVEVQVVAEDQRKEKVDVQNEHLKDCGDKDGFVSYHVFYNNCKFFFVSLNLFFITIFSGVPVDFEINRKTPTLDDFVMPNMRESQLVALETRQTYVSSLVEVDSENICVTPLEVAEAGKTKFNQFGDIEGENTHISSVQPIRTKIPGKYAQSPYTNLSESGGTSVNTVKYCLWRNPFINYKGFDMYSEVILHFKKWVDSKLSKKREKNTSFFTTASDLIDPPFEFGVGRYGPDNSARFTTTDPFFISWVVQIHDAWEANDKDESLISIHHEVAQYIRSDRILANTPWVDVDHVCIPVNSNAAFHWFLVVFSIRKRCLYIYDSLNGYGVKHTNVVTSLVQKISRMIPLFLVANDYYALRKDIDWNTNVHYAGRPVGDPLVYGNHENIPQQRNNSTDCGLYTCAFAEYMCRGDRNISMSGLNAENLSLRFGALLWEYGKMQFDIESVSEDETSKQGGRSNRRVKE